jgi:redox-sensitive bicupin YhaK (pirin superfamily)
MAILSNEADSDGIVVEAAEPARVILVAGQPLNEPIAQYGPFVMNTQAEIHQAMADYRAGRLGQ